ncbi:hypothetical protein MLAC_37420 [Mycobacterium lacus]|uniref:Uncharacterized protein n=1 Tax=Mycobacterium lacus TaxID=169765 RepID=A0A7I7NPW6_9MYCO|nr:hypothetical protein MLAC_37420 [Mycobacterium lacus]
MTGSSTLNAGAGSYATAEAANVQQALLNSINAPTQTLFGRPLGPGAMAVLAGCCSATAGPAEPVESALLFGTPGAPGPHG